MAVETFMDIEETTVVAEPTDPGTIPETDPGESPEAIPNDAPIETPEPVLYETPDGRKVDAETLQREWKEHFLPDYTRKSQELAELKRPPKEEVVPEWSQPDYVPNSYAEVIQIAKQEAIAELERARLAELEQREEITSRVEAQLAELKKDDPKLDENALFQHASKYGFRDLKLAHDNYRVMRDAIAQTETRVLQNVQRRGEAPVAPPTGTPITGDAVDPNVSQRFGSARDFLASLTN